MNNSHWSYESEENCEICKGRPTQVHPDLMFTEEQIKNGDPEYIKAIKALNKATSK